MGSADSSQTNWLRSFCIAQNDKLTICLRKTKTGKTSMTVVDQTPYLLRAARGEILDRPPVWMMRQAGRYMKVYRDLREKYPSFRDTA